jgi:hypothetical protein
MYIIFFSKNILLENETNVKNYLRKPSRAEVKS